MNVFIGIAALLTLLTVAWLVYPLLRSRQGSSGVSIERLNTEIARDQLLSLDSDLARGVINQADFEATRDELQLRLLDDTLQEQPVPSYTGFWTARRTAVAIGLCIPVFGLGIYIQLGTFAAIDPVMAAKADDHQMKQMIDALAAKLKANPDNPAGWAMLGRSYKVTGQFEEAKQAFLKTGHLLDNDPDLMLEYADLLAVKADSNIEGKPLELVNKALSLNPVHPMGLMMSGVAAYRRSDFNLAISQWEKLLTVLEPGSPDAQEIENNIDDARNKASIKKK